MTILLHRSNRKGTALVALISFLTVLSLCMRFEMPDIAGSAQGGAVAEILRSLKLSFKGTALISSVLFIALFKLNMYIAQFAVKKSMQRCASCVGLLLALVWLAAKSFIIDDTVHSICLSPGQIVKSVLYLFGSACFLRQMWLYIYIIAHSRQRNDTLAGASSGLVSLFYKHTIAATLICLTVCWVPQIAISYPGYTCVDSLVQLCQYFGIRAWTFHHPPAHTLLIGSIVNAGIQLTGKAETGLFILIVLQTSLLMLVVGNTLNVMKQLNAPKWLILSALAFFSICPYFSGYTVLILKDNQFSASFLLFMTELAYLSNRKISRACLGHIILFIIGCMGVILFRNNGKYVIYPFFLILIGKALLSSRKGKTPFKASLTLAGVLLFPVLASACFNGLIADRYEVQKGSVREALSLPVQQTARYAREHGDDMTDAEKSVIDMIFDSKSIDELYDPRIADPVKSAFIPDPTGEQLRAYLRVWFAQFLRHPGTYVAATLNQNYYLAFPFTENDTLYNKTIPNARYLEMLEAGNSAFAGLDEFDASPGRAVFRELQSLLLSSPIVGILSSLGFYNLILLGLILIALVERIWDYVIYALPLILSNIVIILAPVIQGHIRYGFPVLYSMPIAITVFLSMYGKKERSGNTESAARSRFRSSVAPYGN